MCVGQNLIYDVPLLSPNNPTALGMVLATGVTR